MNFLKMITLNKNKFIKVYICKGHFRLSTLFGRTGILECRKQLSFLTHTGQWFQVMCLRKIKPNFLNSLIKIKYLNIYKFIF